MAAQNSVWKRWSFMWRYSSVENNGRTCFFFSEEIRSVVRTATDYN
jgi:hypothetical protein